MNKNLIVKWGIFVILALVLTTGLVSANAAGPRTLTSGFTYQGQLKSSAEPYTGSCDFQFKLFDDEGGGVQVGTTQTQTAIPLHEGYFTVVLDFGPAAFNGQARWLEINVRCPAGSGDYTTLSPRQALTAAPYAWFAHQAGSVPWDGITGIPELHGWDLTGNAGTDPATNYLGTSDNVALELRVNGLRALRLEPNILSPNLIGGFSGNSVTDGVFGAVIGGGGTGAGVNTITDHYGVIGGGAGNIAGNSNTAFDDAMFATVGGGWQNQAVSVGSTVGGGQDNKATDEYATVGGGQNNTASGDLSTVGGGNLNTASGGTSTVSGGNFNIASGISSTMGGGNFNTASGNSSTVAGGNTNRASSSYATVGGGGSNTASSNYATVSGGRGNEASGTYATAGGGRDNEASGDYATLSGGLENEITRGYATISGGGYNKATGFYSSVGGGWNNEAEGLYATVPGGQLNYAGGNYSLAAGYRAKANNSGCFVWGDSNDADLNCNFNNRWLARASGGVYFYTNSTLTSGMFLSSGGSAWNAVSNRDLKENFTPVDTAALLEALAQYPITTWNYKAQDDSILHIGMMADEFNRLIDGLGGEGEDYINTMDAVGVSLAAVQGLYAENQELKARLDNLEARLDALEASQTSSVSATSTPLSWLMGFGLAAVAGVWLLRRPHGGA